MKLMATSSSLSFLLPCARLLNPVARPRLNMFVTPGPALVVVVELLVLLLELLLVLLLELLVELLVVVVPLSQVRIELQHCLWELGSGTHSADS